MKKLEKEIYNKLKEIRKILEENGGCQHLMMTIFNDGAMRVYNRYWELPKAKRIDVFGGGRRIKSLFFNLSWFVFNLTISVIIFVLTIIGLCVYKNPMVCIGFAGVGLFLIFTYSTFLSVKESFEKLLLDLILFIQNKEEIR